MWNPWRNRQTRIQFIAGFNVVAALLWFVSYKKLREKQRLLAITAPGTFYTEEDLQEAGFDVIEINRRHLAERAQSMATLAPPPTLYAPPCGLHINLNAIMSFAALFLLSFL